MCVCVCVCVCARVGWVWLRFSRVRVLAKMGNEHQLPLYLLYFGLELRATNMNPPALSIHLSSVSAAAVRSHPGLCSGHC